MAAKPNTRRLKNIFKDQDLLDSLVPEPIPDLESPEVIEARKKQRLAELKRKGRRATILTGGLGVKEGLGSVRRPGAREAVLLGE